MAAVGKGLLRNNFVILKGTYCEMMKGHLEHRHKHSETQMSSNLLHLLPLSSQKNQVVLFVAQFTQLQSH